MQELDLQKQQSIAQAALCLESVKCYGTGHTRLDSPPESKLLCHGLRSLFVVREGRDGSRTSTRRRWRNNLPGGRRRGRKQKVVSRFQHAARDGGGARQRRNIARQSIHDRLGLGFG